MSYLRDLPLFLMLYHAFSTYIRKLFHFPQVSLLCSRSFHRTPTNPCRQYAQANNTIWIIIYINVYMYIWQSKVILSHVLLWTGIKVFNKIHYSFLLVLIIVLCCSTGGKKELVKSPKCSTGSIVTLWYLYVANDIWEQNIKKTI